ncbi:MAG TPA: glycosyltransferase family 4 protein [Chloroflexi bacterium]|jgi:glycosyltransferase involved in cell wall biosynthesis|nr:glycosyltransferase family 4 protein [Chloroflexota bacterium]
MKILMASHGYPPTVSGVTLVVQKLARAMVARGHGVTVVTASDRGEPYEAEDEGVRLVRVSSHDNPFWSEAPIPVVSRKTLDGIVETFEPDVLHIHDAALLALQFLRLSRRIEAPLVASCYYVPRFVTRYLGGEITEDVVEAAIWAYSVWLLNQCDRVVFATRAHRDFFQDQGLKAPTALISNGLDIHRYRPADGADEGIEARYALPAGPRILFVSRLARDKAIDVLIRAMPAVRAEVPTACLLLVGRGDYRPALEQLVEALGLEEAVRFLGFVPEDDMPALYRACACFAIASTYEVQSLPTLQALATGLPVVAADAVALPEIVKDGVNGYLTPPGDHEAVAEAIVRILTDPERAAAMAREGLAIVQPHAEEHTFDLYEELYCSLF